MNEKEDLKNLDHSAVLSKDSTQRRCTHPDYRINSNKKKISVTTPSIECRLKLIDMIDEITMEQEKSQIRVSSGKKSEPDHIPQLAKSLQSSFLRTELCDPMVEIVDELPSQRETIQTMPTPSQIAPSTTSDHTSQLPQQNVSDLAKSLQSSFLRTHPLSSSVVPTNHDSQSHQDIQPHFINSNDDSLKTAHLASHVSDLASNLQLNFQSSLTGIQNKLHGISSSLPHSSSKKSNLSVKPLPPRPTPNSSLQHISKNTSQQSEELSQEKAGKTSPVIHQMISKLWSNTAGKSKSPKKSKARSKTRTKAVNPPKSSKIQKKRVLKKQAPSMTRIKESKSQPSSSTQLKKPKAKKTSIKECRNEVIKPQTKKLEHEAHSTPSEFDAKVAKDDFVKDRVQTENTGKQKGSTQTSEKIRTKKKKKTVLKKGKNRSNTIVDISKSTGEKSSKITSTKHNHASSQSVSKKKGGLKKTRLRKTKIPSQKPRKYSFTNEDSPKSNSTSQFQVDKSASRQFGRVLHVHVPHSPPISPDSALSMTQIMV